MHSDRVDTIVVGGGQAGLAAGYFLAQARRRFVILDALPRIGDMWRSRWDSLRLFTPAKFSHLPGLPFPADDFYFPSKDEFADYLEQYAARFELPVELNARSESLSKEEDHYTVIMGGRQCSARNVIVATGGYQVPVVPAFACDLDPAIFQMHSSKYKNANPVPQGKILVVGAGNSGAEIAIELARHGRQVWLAGKSVGRIPAMAVGRILGGWPYWFFLTRILSVYTPIGRKVRKKALYHGAPLIRLRPSDITDAGVTRSPRVSGVSNGRPELEDGQVLDVAGIVWATGFRPDYSWIKLPVFDEHGYPRHDRGQVRNTPGLSFLGLTFQTAISSGTIGGVALDARRLIKEMDF